MRKGNRDFALGRMKAGKMNKTEAAYDKVLKGLLQIGQIQWYRFEGIKLRLADATFYSPDFAVMDEDGVIEVGETVLHGAAHTFGDVPEGAPVALVDSTDYLAIAVRNGSAAETMGLDVGSPIEIWPIANE